MPVHALRRPLCAGLALLLVGVSGCSALPGPEAATAGEPGGPADRVLRNGHLYTLDSGSPWAEALAIDAGRIVYVGDDAGVEALIGPNTDVVDLRGRFGMPGVHDAHVHLLEAHHLAAGTCQLEAGMSEAQMFDELVACPPRQVGTTWVQGWGHSIHDLLALPYAPVELLDDAIPDVPALVMEATSHSVWVNSAGLAAAGITGDTPNPPGGRILLDNNGEPNGILLDAAGELVLDLAYAPTEELEELNDEALREGVRAAHGVGIIGVVDARAFYKRGYVESYERVDAAGDLKLHANLALWAYASEADEAQLAALIGRYRGDPGANLQVRQVKIYADGLIENTTAALLDPYLGPTLVEGQGLNYFDLDRLTTYTTVLESAGFDLHIHAIGDRGVRESLDAIAAARAKNGDLGRHHRLTHVELVHPEDVGRFAELGVSADLQMTGEWVLDGKAGSGIGQARWDERGFRLRDLYDSGASVVLSSDFDVGSLSPFIGIEHALTRGDQSLPDVDAAIREVTINAARLSHLEGESGTLEVGKSADVIVLDRDLTQVAADTIGETKVLLTLFRGVTVHEGGRL